MTVYFEAIDPRGYRVICSKQIWYDKILDKRPFMAGWEQQIIVTIENPSWICQAAQHKDRNVYYYLQLDRSPRYLRVIVKFNKNNFGRIISAYPADSGKTGEKLIWPQSKD